jgi:hypothetical protein
MSGDDEAALRGQVAALEETVRQLSEQVNALRENQVSPQWKQWVTAQVQGEGEVQEVDPERLTTLEKYARMSMDERVSTLGASNLRATIILENWPRWSQRGPYGDEAITTTMTRPDTLRVLLRERDPTVDVEGGEDLKGTQVYRAMRAVHRLTDGAIRYDEDCKHPDNTSRETYHALTLAAPDEVPTLYR